MSETLVNQYENEMLRQKIQGYSNQLDVMLQGEEKVKALRHDMKHHMNWLHIDCNIFLYSHISYGTG